MEDVPQATNAALSSKIWGNISDPFRLAVAKGISALDWNEFEKLAAAVFEGKGYDVRLTPTTNDQGIDLFLTDKESGALEVVQCKHWMEQIGSPVVRDFYGAMVHFNARKGYILATGGMSDSAREFARGKSISYMGIETLIDEVIETSAYRFIERDMQGPGLLKIKHRVYRSIAEQVEGQSRRKLREELKTALTAYAMKPEVRNVISNFLDNIQY